MDKKKKTPKQIAALVCVGLLLLLYLATLVVACLNFRVRPPVPGLPGGNGRASHPLWIYIWLFGKIKERRQGQDNSNGK